MMSSDALVVPEPARRVLAQERASGGRATGDQDPALFVERMLQVALSDAENASEAQGVVLFDRGIPDLIAYAAYYDIGDWDIRQALQRVTYDARVFWFPAWEDIYTTDDERTMSYSEAAEFGELIFSAYRSLGYDLIHVPLKSPRDRAEFIQAQLS